ncbi:MAG: hypothetical protein ACOYMA_02795 [Bacteroidia bacterium]
MKTRFINLLIVFILIISCNNDEIDRDNSGKSDWVDTSEIMNKSKVLEKTEDLKNLKYKSDIDTNVYVKGFNLEKTMKFLFSNKETPDEFKVIIKGFKVYSATIEFTITNSKGKQIFYDNFSVNGVLSNAFDGNGEYATNIQKEEFLRKWIVTFLSNESFLTPAIMAEREFFAEHSNQLIWDEIAADENAIGFVYSKKLSSQTEIAFDKKLNKVVTYYEY